MSVPGIAQDLSGHANSLCSWASLFGCLYWGHFVRVSKSTGPLLIMVVRMIFDNMLKFFSILGLFLMAFTLAFYVIYLPPMRSAITNDQWQMPPESTQEFSSISSFGTIPVSIDTLLRIFTFGNFDYAVLDMTYESQHTSLPFIFYYLYVFFACILLLNLLIAMMNDTYSSIRLIVELQWKLQMASVILELEESFSFARRRRPETHLHDPETNSWWMLVDPDDSPSTYKMLEPSKLPTSTAFKLLQSDADPTSSGGSRLARKMRGVCFVDANDDGDEVRP
mmetsp:Transcript_8218/g.18034  ORF Transcript_8218/g.18034 Transcript_8218/m.18034 type:complete len:280 (-) Transcript_8218:313-1152(-)|eukprot:CAMPEP_0183338658 /NCGR_PEP_ID=MMETSP0164_2-20130417/5873_1 /TAXON_ID=221442 /ORGANISM="Coccolithus pelagicus ssp braarudi, Strain PLY182g" /LENGTH=279 /DNA_ID=CAMNT_0025508541 /DNA_START=23 /DNA_END=862 /DNA_ORIENTATION=-